MTEVTPIKKAKVNDIAVNEKNGESLPLAQAGHWCLTF